MKLLTNLKKSIFAGTMIALFAFAPSFANESDTTTTNTDSISIEEVIEVEETVETEEVIEVEETTEIEEVVVTEETTKVEETVETEEVVEIVENAVNTDDIVKSVQTEFSSKEELFAYCESKGYTVTRNHEKDSLNGESHFIIMVCGTEAKVEVIVTPAVDEEDDEIVDEPVKPVVPMIPLEPAKPVVPMIPLEPSTPDVDEPVIDEPVIDEPVVDEPVVADAVYTEEIDEEPYEDFMINPKTGDESMVLYLTLAIVSLIGFVIVNRKKVK